VIPRRLCRIRCGEAVLRLAAVLVDLDCTDTDRRAGAFAPALLCVEFAVNEYDATADDFPSRRSLVASVFQNAPNFVVEGFDDPVLERDID
jgi:hypothetical protein